MHHSLISTSFLRRKSRGIVQSRILKFKVAAALQGLDLPPQPGRDNCSPSHSLLPPLSNSLKKLSHMIQILSMRIPLVMLLGRSGSPFREGGSMVINIKPLRFPIPNLTAQSYGIYLSTMPGRNWRSTPPILAIFLRLGHRFKEKDS